jgi:starch-binding outer membrane protein, SusD/RagB family
MKRNIIIFLVLGFFLTLGCEKLPVGNEFLSKAPGVDVTQDTVFSTLDYAQRFLWNAYFWLPYGLDQTETGLGMKMEHELLQDITDLSNSKMGWGGVANYYYSGTYTASSENGSNSTKYSLGREAPYGGIRKAYIFIENIDRVPDIDATLSKQLKAEAKMIIAILYSEIYRHYGGVPWVNHSYDITDNMSSMPRLTAQATCDSIVDLCDKAAPDLPWVISPSDMTAWDGRLTKAGAMALKARVLLFNASPIFNAAAPYLDGAAAQQKLVWHGAYNASLWKKAADAARAVITQVEAGADYKLVSSGIATMAARRADFQKAYLARGNGEILISTRKIYQAATGYTFYTASFSWGSGCPTQEVVDMFPMANGTPILASGSGYNPAFPFFTAAGVAVRDPRLYETVLVNGDAFQGRTAELYIGGRERTAISGVQAHTGYIVRKFMLDHNSSTSIGGIVQWPFLRLPEIYLSYAEADNEFNGGPSAEAYRCVNVVRRRVGLNDLTPGLTQVQFREAILTERVCEFAVEENRWFDMVRWKRESDFTKILHGTDLTRSASAPYTFTYTLSNLPTRFWQKSWSPKWYFSAYPLAEIQKGYGLVQNPGWE